jgi:hypothetical protein
MDLEGALSRVDSATSYYQVLGVERLDGQEKIKSSFQQLLNLLFPPYAVARTIAPDTLARIDRAFSKASQAFSVLASFARRKEYDGALTASHTPPVASPAPGNPPFTGSSAVIPPRPVVTPITKPIQVGQDLAKPPTVISPTKNSQPGGSDRSQMSNERSDLALGGMPQRGVAYRESINAKITDNRRRCERFKLCIPARVTGYDRRNGKWNEMTETIDVSRTGVRLRLHRPVRHGTVVYLTLPLPGKLRAHGFSEQSYNAYALVRRIEPSKQGLRVVGVEFIGEHPPAGFLERPWSVFRPKKWAGSERRRPNRDDEIHKIRIEYFTESMHSIKAEEARTENISKSGLRISGTKAPAEFDLIMISCPGLRFEALATLRSRYEGRDGLERICVHLLDKEWPGKR